MKRIAILTLMFCLLFTLTGCTSVQSDLLAEMKATHDWEAATISQEGTIHMSIMGMEQEMAITSEGYMNIKDAQGKITTQVIDQSGQVELPTMEMYIDDYNTYINKDYFSSIFSSSNLPLPKNLRELDADYIGIESFDEELTQLLTSLSSPELTLKIYDLYEALGKELGIDIPVEKHGDAYTISLDGEQLAKILVQLMNENNLNKCIEIINETLDMDLAPFAEEVVGLTPEELTMFHPLILEVKYGFDNDLFTQEVVMSYNLDKEITMDLHLFAETKNVPAKKVDLPKNTVMLTMDEYQKLFVINGSVISLNEGMLAPMNGVASPAKINVLNKNGEIFLPIRALMNSMGYEVGYDAESAAVTIAKDELSVPVAVIVEDSTSYISVKELMKQLFVVQTLDENTLLVME